MTKSNQTELYQIEPAAFTSAGLPFNICLDPKFPVRPRRRHHSTLHSPVPDTVKLSFIGNPGGPTARTDTTRSDPSYSLFLQHFPSPSLSWARIPMGTRPPYPTIPPAPVIVRSGSASPRIAAGSDALPAGAASSAQSSALSTLPGRTFTARQSPSPLNSNNGR